MSLRDSSAPLLDCRAVTHSTETVGVFGFAYEIVGNKWTDSQREKFANDPVNLFAVDARVKRQKGTKGPREWLPPRERFHCQYVTRFERVLITTAWS